SHYYLIITMTETEVAEVLQSITEDLDKRHSITPSNDQLIDAQIATDILYAAYNGQSHQHDTAGIFGRLGLDLDASPYQCMLMNIYGKIMIGQPKHPEQSVILGIM